MENFSRYLGINGTLTLICCLFCCFLPRGKAAWKTISEVVGSRVTLQCKNESIGKLTQVTWKMNGINMLTFMNPDKLHISQEATNLTLNMSTSESQLYALIIERAQTHHTGNYTCETSTINGILEQNWSLIITESIGNWDKLKIIILPCVSLLILIFLIGLAVLIRYCKRNTANSSQSPPAETRQQTEDVYENCLEIERYNQRLGHHYKPSAR